MKRLLAYLFIVLGLGLTFSVNLNGKDIDKEFYKFKKISIPLSNDGSWKLIGKKIQHIHSARLTWIYLAQTKNDQLSKLIELVHVTVAQEDVSESLIWFKNFVYQINGFNSCIPKSSSGKSATLVEKYYVYEEPEKSTGCFFTRNMDIKREIFYPSIKRKTDYVDTNHFPKIIKKYLNNEDNLPKIMLRSDHYFTSQTELYGYFEMINPDVNGAPNTLFESEKKSEYHPLNIDNHPQKKNFYLTWIKSQAKKHLKFETELKRKYKIDLAKYINFEPIKDLKNVDKTKKTVKKEIKIITKKKKVKVAKVEEQKKEEFKPKKIIKSSEVNFYKIKQGDIIDNPIISISTKNKIALPKGNWQVVKKTKVNGWRDTDVMILVNQSTSDSSSFGEFIEISVTSILEKNMYVANQELREPCKKKNYFHDLQKTSGSGNSFSCFATGLAKNDIFKTPLNNFNPWNYKFRDYFSEKETLTDNILFSLSAYSGGTRTKSRLISVIYGSSLNSISDKNKIDFENEELIKNIWTKKTIDFHNNFQKNMNFKESHLINLDAEYQDLENKYADLIKTVDQKQKVKKIIKKEKKAKKKLVVDKEISEEQKKIADKKAKAEKKKKLAQKKIEEEEKKLVEKKAKEEAENQKILSSKNIDTEITNDENSADNKNFLETLAKKEVLEPNKKKIIRYECQQPWDLTTEDYRPLLDIYELDLEDRVLIGTHRYITDKEYTEERTYPILAKDKNRVLVRYDSPNGNFTTKFFFNYGTDQSIVAADNSYKTQAKCVNRDYFVDIKFAKKKVDNLELSKKDLKALEEAKNEALLAEKEIKEIEKEQEELLAKQEKILKKQKQGTETTKVAKLKIYEDPKKLNKSFSSSISKSNFKKYKATSTVSYLFFESSENYLISLELLYRAYDLNTEAEKIRSHLSYMKESKSSENQRLKSTRQIVQEQTVTISNNIKNESIALTEQGKVYYAQALPYALNASIATYNLFHVAKNTINNVGNQGDVVFGILNNLNNVIGMVQILPQLPSYSKNMYQTTKLIITRAKTKKIKESTSTKKALDDLNLEI